MKLYDIAMAILNPHQRVILKEGEESSKVVFDGTANQLLEYDGLNRRIVEDIAVKENALVLYLE